MESKSEKPKYSEEHPRKASECKKCQDKSY